MTREQWVALFHNAGLRVEIAEIAARLAKQRVDRLFSDAIARGRRLGVRSVDLAAMFDCTRQSVFRIATKAGVFAELASQRKAPARTPAKPKRVSSKPRGNPGVVHQLPCGASGTQMALFKAACDRGFVGSYKTFAQRLKASGGQKRLDELMPARTYRGQITVNSASGTVDAVTLHDPARSD